MLSINTNLSSLIAQSSLKESTNLLNRAVERMTTGYKINGAKDNAANYSISTNMTTKINSYMVAEDNAAMGLDMVTSMTSNLELIEDHTRRIRDLTEQASNGTYGEESLKAIQAEIDARLEEIERIKSSAEYNGVSLLESSAGGGGPKVPTKLLKEVTPLTETEALAKGYTLVSDETELITALSNNESVCLMNDIDITQPTMYFGGGVSGYVDSYSNATIEGNGYSINFVGVKNTSYGIYALINRGSNINFKNIELNDVNTTGLNVFYTIGSASGDILFDNVAISGKIESPSTIYFLTSSSSAANVTFKDSYVDVDSIGSATNVTLTSGATLIMENSYYNKTVLGDLGDGGVSKAELDAILTPNTGGEKTVTLQVGINGDSNSQITFASSIALQVLSIDCSDSTTARGCLQSLDDYLKVISAKQTELGAVTNRLESVLQEIAILYDNLVSSRSTLRDADIAKESSTYIQQQILQQASSTLLATANQSPSIALQLI